MDMSRSLLKAGSAVVRPPGDRVLLPLAEAVSTLRRAADAGAPERVYGRAVRWLRSEVAAVSAADRLLVLGLVVCGELEVWLLGAGGASRGFTAAAVLLMTLPLAVRRRRPLLALGAALAGFTAIYATTDISSDDDAFVPWIVMLVAAYSAGALTQGGAAMAGAPCALAFPLVLAVTDPEGFSLSGLLFYSSIVLPPYLAGVAIARRRRRETALERHAAALDADREQATAAAVAGERARIARELHDVVAHGVSTIVVQAQGGGRMVRVEPGEAEAAFAAIERTGQQALTEMRRLLGMLRAADEGAALAPQPGVERLGQLIEGVREAGLPVDLQVRGAVTALPPGVDVSAYRIVQEALTNTIKHAGAAHARVQLRYEPGAIELEIRDNGAGNEPRDQNGGHGLIGMRERVSIYGGRLEAGSPSSGGYRIWARLPFEAAGR
jgi:signal transduction histidine kinase